MKIKLDENLQSELCEILAVQGHDVDTVHHEGLQGHPDVDIWRAAKAEERFLITQDLDFSDARQYQPGTHAGILLVRFREPTRHRLLDRLTQVFERNDIRN